MKTVYLLRHAKAEPAKGREKDNERGLSQRGHETCDTIGNYLKEKKYIPELVLVSSARRTSETCALVMQRAGFSPEIVTDQSLYLATSEDMTQHINHVKDSIHCVMIIGHNPGMHHLAMNLAKPVGNALYSILENKYPTGALTVLTFATDSWQEVKAGRGKLTDFMTPA